MSLIYSFISRLKYFINRGEKRRISLAITVYNRPKLILAAIAYPIQDLRIDEIVIYDDGSTWVNHQDMLRLIGKKHNKIKIIRGEKNIGPFGAKFNAVKHCQNQWVILLDSDNSFNYWYINRLYRFNYWDEDIIYCPNFARPNFNFREFSGEMIDLGRAKELFRKYNPRFITTLLNTGNYFLNRDNYVKCLGNYVRYRVPAGDVLAANYLWMKSGKQLKVVGGLTYNHLVHEGSNFKNKGSLSRAEIRRIRESIINESSLDFTELYNECLDQSSGINS